MKNIAVLGAGMVGSAIAADLTANYNVTVLDRNPEALDNLKRKYNLTVREADLSKENNFDKYLKSIDLAVCAVPGFMGFETLRKIIETGTDTVDISFFNRDPFELDELAKRKNVTAIVDCGVAPGMSNIVAGYHSAKMKVDSFEFMVGGLPARRTLPYQYKAPFSPIDVIEEYTRPARFLENGKVVIKAALSGRELVDMEPVGTLEAFNTDGLRTLLKTLNIPNMKEKTLRYPGHLEYIKLLSESGFFGTEPVDVNGVKIKPIDLSSKLLFPIWKLAKDEDEFTIMKITVTGLEDGVMREYVYNLFDKYDHAAGISSMARITGFTCTAAVNLVLKGKYTEKGISPPEFIGKNEGCFKEVTAYLEERNVVYKVAVRDLHQ